MLTSFKLSAKLSTESLLLFLHGCQLKNFNPGAQTYKLEFTRVSSASAVNLSDFTQ